MGIDADFGWAYAKAQAAASSLLPRTGKAFLSVKKPDRPLVLEVARRLHALGFSLAATSGTADFLRGQGLAVESVHKVHEGRPHVVDHMKNGEIAVVMNTVASGAGKADSLSIRREALHRGIPYYTTIRGALAAVMGIEATVRRPLTIRSLQEHHQATARA